MILILHHLLIAAVISLEPSRWEELKFNHISSNQVVFRNSGISIEVNSSASPLLNVFPTTRPIRRIEVNGVVTGDPHWSPGTDDALLRVGVIENGKKRLNPVQRATAPGWLRRIDELVGATGNGVEKIHCFLLTPDADKVGQVQPNPNASIFQEAIQSTPENDGTFKIVAEFPEPVSSSGLWLMADGDDSGSRFEVRIESIAWTE